jgi:hypothetical protein
MVRVGGGGEIATVVVAEAALFRQLLSAMTQFGFTIAVSVIEPVVGGAFTLIVSVAFAPVFTAPPVHDTIWPDVLQLKRLLVVVETQTTPAGSVSCSAMFVALAVPTLLTVSV